MSMLHVNLNPVPYEEDYDTDMVTGTKQVKRHIELIKQCFGEPPETVRFEVYNHPFDSMPVTYSPGLRVHYSAHNVEAAAYIELLQNEELAHWDVTEEEIAEYREMREYAISRALEDDGDDLA